MKSEIIIVGNGTSLLEKENESLIDSYDNVVRFNAFSIKGYEKYVGTKSTIWFNVINFADKNNWKMFHNWEKIYLHSWQWDKLKDKLYIDFIDFFKKHDLNFEKIIKTTPNITDEIAAFAGNLSYKSFSTGIIAIWEMIKLHENVDIIGFDWWGKENHHYNDNAIRGTLHKPKIEKEIIDKLVRENKIINFYET